MLEQMEKNTCKTIECVGNSCIMRDFYFILFIMFMAYNAGLISKEMCLVSSNVFYFFVAMYNLENLRSYYWSG